MHPGDMGLTLIQIAGLSRRGLVGIASQTLHDRVHGIMLADPAQVDGPFDLGHRILGQALQHADVLPRPARGTVLCFEVLHDPRVTPKRIQQGAKKFKIHLHTEKHGQELKLVIPESPEDIAKLLQYLAGELYISELTEQPCETNSYRPLQDTTLSPS
jgi:hypothetical protein